VAVVEGAGEDEAAGAALDPGPVDAPFGGSAPRDDSENPSAELATNTPANDEARSARARDRETEDLCTNDP
jgi:hypothetical protein